MHSDHAATSQMHVNVARLQFLVFDFVNKIALCVESECRIIREPFLSTMYVVCLNVVDTAEKYTSLSLPLAFTSANHCLVGFPGEREGCCPLRSVRWQWYLQAVNAM